MQTVVKGTNSPPWEPERISPPNVSKSTPTLSLNGNQVRKEDIASEVNYHAESELPTHGLQGAADDEDGRQSLEDTTGSITSVD